LRPALSVRSTLMIWLIPAVVSILVLSVTAAYFFALRAVDISYDHSLLAQATDLSNFVRRREGRLTFALPPDVETVLRDDGGDSVFFALHTPNGVFIGGDRDIPMFPTRETATAESSSGVVHNQRVRILAAAFNVDAIPFIVTVAETDRQRKQAVLPVIVSMLVAEVIIVTLAALLVWFGIRNATGILQRLQREVSVRTAYEVTPIGLERVPDELHSLVRALNDLLRRLAQAYAEQHRFVADAAHQLRTPLARIQTQVEVLKNLPTADLPAQVQRLESSVAHTVRLANQLLSLARAEADAGRTHKKHEVDLARVAEDMMERWIESAGERNIDIGFELRPSLARCDAFIVGEAMTNLIDNAIRYTPAGGVVNISTGAEDGVVYFTVDDSGPGIPAEYYQQIFERFFRLPNSPGEGTGLGLAIVDAIVRAQSATVKVSNSALGGTRVSLQFALNGESRSAA
jgi:two-component system sensor histidine kinase TctE